MKQKKNSILDLVQFTKDMEQRELIKTLRKHGTPTEDGGFEYTFKKDDRPIVAGYAIDVPSDLSILYAKVDNRGYLTLMAEESHLSGDGFEFDLDPDDIFAGHAEFIADQIKYLAA